MANTPRCGKFHRRLDLKRRITAFLSSHQTLLVILWIFVFAVIFMWQSKSSGVDRYSKFPRLPSRPIPKLRPFAFNLSDFGGVGDGATVNTQAFEKAILAIAKLGKKGGGQLNVEAGYWLTAPFNLTSHMTLFLAEGAVILGIDVSNSCTFSKLAYLPSFWLLRKRREKIKNGRLNVYLVSANAFKLKLYQIVFLPPVLVLLPQVLPK